MSDTNTKKVAILGLAPSYKFAPFNDPTWEIWGLNDAFSLLPRYDRWFEMHSENHIKTYKCRFDENINYYDWLKKATVPIYMQEKYDNIPNSVEYPLKNIINIFGDYFTNTISYMIALAIYEGYEEIALYGVNMESDGEYQDQRPSVEYFIGIQKGKSLINNTFKEVFIHESSPILKSAFLYGYEMIPNGIKKIIDTKLNDFNKNIEELKAQELNNKTCIDNVMGGINYFNFVRTSLLNIAKEFPETSEIIQNMLNNDANSLNNTLIKYKQEESDIQNKLSYYQGANIINKYYKNLL